MLRIWNFRMSEETEPAPAWFDRLSAMPAKEIQVRGEYITLGQLLKLTGEVSGGGDVKAYLASHRPIVNGESENRRGRKLRPGDKVVFAKAGEINLK